MGRKRGSRGGGRSSRSSKSRSRSSGRSTRGGTASKSSGGSKSSKGGAGRGRSTSSRGSGGSRSKGSTSKAKATSWSTSQTGALGAAIAASKKANPGAWSKALSGSGSTATSTKAHWSTSQTGQLGAAIAASQKANPLAWGKAIAGGGTSAMSTSLSDFTSAVNKANEASYQGRKHVVNMANVGTGGTWNIGAAASSFFSSTPFSLMPSASADSATKKTDISGGAISAEQSLTGESVAGWGITVGDSYLVNGGADMQNKAAEGLNNILSMTEKKTDIASLQAQAKAAGWGENTGAPAMYPGMGMMSASSIDPSGDWYGQYAQKYPGLFVPKQKHVGIAVPKSYQKQFDKYEKIVAFADKHGQDNATVDRAKRLLSLYRGIITNWKGTDMAIQSGYELKSTHAGDAQLFHAQTGERVIITKAEQALISKFHSDPASLTATQTDQAAMLQAKKENTVVQFTTETVQVPVSTKVQMGEDGKPLPYAQQVGPDGKPEVKYETVIQTKYDQDKDTISTLSTPWGSPTGYSVTPFSSDANREAWKAEGGSNLISSWDSWLKYKYTDNPDPRLRQIPYWFDTRDRIEMTDINDDGVPDQLSIVPYEFDTKERILPEQPEMPVTDIPQFLPAEQYEVPYYVDISAAEKRLEGGESFESIMEKPPLMSDYMYWTDPQDSKEYIMTHDDHKEYLQAVATQKKVIKQQKYDEVFMDVTRGKGPVIPRAMGKRSGASAGPAIQRVMSGTAPREADIGGLVK